jgi:tight adherence protein B
VWALYVRRVKGDSVTVFVITIALCLFAFMQAGYWFLRGRGEGRAANLLARLGGVAADVEVSLLRQEDDEASLIAGLRHRMRQAGDETEIPAFFAKSALFALVGGLIALILSGAFAPSVLGALIGFLVPYLQLSQRRRTRLMDIEKSIPEALQIIIISLRAGHPLPKAVETTAQEMSGPLRSEFQVLAEELKLGRSVEESFLNFGNRLGSVGTVRTLVVAIVVLQQTGGNLVEVLDQLVGALHDQAQYTRKLAAMTAEGRMSARILGGLPPTFLFLTYLVAPDYIMTLFTSVTGLGVFGLACALYGLGMLWLRSMMASGAAT